MCKMREEEESEVASASELHLPFAKIDRQEPKHGSGSSRNRIRIR
jgi:hypothetical protein